jgi:carbon storage regulator
MLVLARKRGEKIICSNGISILVAEIAHGKVKLAIEAPQEVRIWREELEARKCQRIGRSNGNCRSADRNSA